MDTTIKELRAALKAAGFTLKTRKNSEFIEAYIYNKDGEKMPSIFTAHNLFYWESALKIRSEFRGKVYDGNFRVVL